MAISDEKIHQIEGLLRTLERRARSAEITIESLCERTGVDGTYIDAWRQPLIEGERTPDQIIQNARILASHIRDLP